MKVEAVLAAAAQKDVTSNILLSVFHDSISPVCYSAAHWEATSKCCGLETHAVLTKDAGLMDDLRGSSG